MIGDLFSKPNNGALAQPATLASAKSTGVDTVDISIATGWPVDADDGPIHFKIFKTEPDPQEDGKFRPVEGSITDWKGTLAGTTISNMDLRGGSNQGYEVGDSCIIYPTAGWGYDLIEGLSVAHERDGKLKTEAVKEALNTGDTDEGGWSVLAEAPRLVSTNGNNSFDISFDAANYTDRLSEGMRLKIPRTGTTPTQCADFNGTTQYASKAAPTGINTTTQITVEDWIWVDSYKQQTIKSRYNGANSSGWNFSLNTAGQLTLDVREATKTVDSVTSYQSVPLGRWVHVAATIDIATATGKTYFDGVEVTSVYTNGTTTTITQNGDMIIGQVVSSGFFDGRTADSRVWNIVRTASQIRDNMNQQLTGSEPGLVGYWKLDENFNDSTVNANHLTPAGGATATYAASPFNEYAYLIIMTKPVFSGGNTTTTVQCPTGYSIPNQTLGVASYSTSRIPYGFPSERAKWEIIAFWRNGTWGLPGLAASTWGAIHGFSAPVGNWDAAYQGQAFWAGTSGAYRIISTSLSTATTSASYPELSVSSSGGNTAVTAARDSHAASANIDLTAAQTLWLLVRGKFASTSIGFLDEDDTPVMIRLTNGYL